MPKFVLYHPESNSHMYASSEDERDVLTFDGLLDVTGDENHEALAEAQLGPFNPDGNMNAAVDVLQQAMDESAATGQPVEAMEGIVVAVGAEAMMDALYANLEASGEVRQRIEVPTAMSDAFDTYREHLNDDPETAWAWHCNIACAAMDEGVEHGAANRIAYRFMYAAFSVDTSTHPEYERIQKAAKAEADRRFSSRHYANLAAILREAAAVINGEIDRRLCLTDELIGFALVLEEQK